ncbi:hypothetical protein HYH02_004804 [Chlamydomonas schloesseri]|uniref:tRNA (guanine(46)-N(7))-methyltransferase n=1 Tax=Chlamydomonas schloesseri TaxID=2026947 RepID=A0A835WME2_9CHLO|nr:hypothetical protein HYH02_004804 [Chlamydomonas schloesseri]|eukprot:KAG2450297.1 hypothetical protein HYH02_004804 [Chlamydomonas schloesseri]
MSPKRQREEGGTAEGDKGEKGQTKAQKEEVAHPRKRFYRARAHSNPLNDASFDVPTRPEDYDWTEHYPELMAEWRERQAAAGAGAEGAGAAEAEAEAPAVRFVDIGCGFGGLLIKLATHYPDTPMLGMEIRDKVTAYVRERIGAKPCPW